MEVEFIFLTHPPSNALLIDISKGRSLLVSLVGSNSLLNNFYHMMPGFFNSRMLGQHLCHHNFIPSSFIQCLHLTWVNRYHLSGCKLFMVLSSCLMRSREIFIAQRCHQDPVSLHLYILTAQDVGFSFLCLLPHY